MNGLLIEEPLTFLFKEAGVGSGGLESTDVCEG
jgi:hypothetical protein